MSTTDTSDRPDDGGEISIFGRTIKAQHLGPLMKFYEADHPLTTDERRELAKDISNGRLVSLLWASIDCLIAFLAPTAYKRFTDRRAGNPPPAGAAGTAATGNATFTGNTAGTLPRVPNGAVRRPVFHRPVLSTLLAMGVYFTSLYVHGRKHQEWRIGELEKEYSDGTLSQEERESKHRLAAVWKALSPAQLLLFAEYYAQTARNPAMKLKSPKEVAAEGPHAVHYMPPPERSIGEGFGGFAKTHVDEKPAPHWEKIREVNGFGKPVPNGSSPELANFGTDGSRVDDLTPPEPELQPTSAWERLRKSN